MVCSLISQDNDCSMGYMAIRCEVATFPIRFGKLSPPLFCYFSSSAAAPWPGMQQPCGSPCSPLSCHSPLCTEMLIGPNPPLEAVLVAWPGTLKDTLVWNTKGPIQVPREKRHRAFQHDSQLNEGRGVRAGDGDGAHHHSDNKWSATKAAAAAGMRHQVFASYFKGFPQPRWDMGMLIASNLQPAHTHTLKWLQSSDLPCGHRHSSTWQVTVRDGGLLIWKATVAHSAAAVLQVVIIYSPSATLWWRVLTEIMNANVTVAF